MFLVAQQTAESGGEQSIFALYEPFEGYRAFLDYFGGQYLLNDFVALSFEVAPSPDLNAHVFGFAVDSSGNTVGYKDSIATSGTLTPLGWTTASLAGLSGSGLYTAMQAMCDVGYLSNVSSADAATILSIFAQLGNITL
jgi:hypothetical protein